VEEDTVAPGLNEEVIRLISRKKGEPDWLLDSASRPTAGG
jgi:Fe-S cluster assembly protein SufB